MHLHALTMFDIILQEFHTHFSRLLSNQCNKQARRRPKFTIKVATGAGNTVYIQFSRGARLPFPIYPYITPLSQAQGKNHY